MSGPTYAFPVSNPDSVFCPGMTLRDYFAGQALAAIISKSPFLDSPDDYTAYKKTAIGAYDYADAMIAAREQSS